MALSLYCKYRKFSPCFESIPQKLHTYRTPLNRVTWLGKGPKPLVQSVMDWACHALCPRAFQAFLISIKEASTFGNVLYCHKMMQFCLTIKPGMSPDKSCMAFPIQYERNSPIKRLSWRGVVETLLKVMLFQVYVAKTHVVRFLSLSHQKKNCQAGLPSILLLVRHWPCNIIDEGCRLQIYSQCHI